MLAERPSPQVEVSSYNFQYTCAVQEWRILTQAPWNPSQCFYKVTTSSLGLNHSSIITLLKNALWFTFVMHFCETFLTSSGILLPWSKSQLGPVMVVVFISYTCRPWPNSWSIHFAKKYNLNFIPAGTAVKRTFFSTWYSDVMSVNIVSIIIKVVGFYLLWHASPLVGKSTTTGDQ